MRWLRCVQRILRTELKLLERQAKVRISQSSFFLVPAIVFRTTHLAKALLAVVYCRYHLRVHSAPS